MEKIKFIRHFTAYREDWFDVIYKSGRCCSFILEDLPKTARAFIDNAKNCVEQYDKTFDRQEFIYTMD